jgi:hypothetical protein
MNPEHYDFCTVDGEYREITVDGITSRRTVHVGVDFLRPIMQLVCDPADLEAVGSSKATARMNCAVTVDEEAWLKQGRVVWIEPQ